MKFTWGTGIVVFLILFLAACATFIIFAYNQDVNLVHEDYYEKGVDYSQQMNRDSRSLKYKDQIEISELNDSVRIFFPEEVIAGAESVRVLFFRPSDHNLDINLPVVFTGNFVSVSKENLVPGRYIVKLTWKMDKFGYEIDKTFIVK
jgi:hypothetical protein